jgi:hypothetical protein
MGAIDDAHPARADNVNHDVLADLLYERIRTFTQTALGYLRCTLAGFQGGLCSSVPLLAGFTRFFAGILQGTILTQASYTLPDPFLHGRAALIQKCTPGHYRYNQRVS